MKKILLGFVLLLPLATSADAATVVAICGTLPVRYVVGSTRPMTVDVNGNLCT